MSETVWHVRPEKNGVGPEPPVDDDYLQLELTFAGILHCVGFRGPGRSPWVHLSQMLLSFLVCQFVGGC